MNERLITKKAVRQVLSDYWQQYKSRPLNLYDMGKSLIFKGQGGGSAVDWLE